MQKSRPNTPEGITYRTGKNVEWRGAGTEWTDDEDETLTQLPAPTRASWIPTSLEEEASYSDFERDEVPTLVFERPAPDAEAKRDSELSVVFHNVQKAPPRHATIPPPPLQPGVVTSVASDFLPQEDASDDRPPRALLPMPEIAPTASPRQAMARSTLPPLPHPSSALAVTGPSSLYRDPAHDSLRPVAYGSSNGFPGYGPQPTASSGARSFGARAVSMLAPFAVGSLVFAAGFAWWNGERGELVIDVEDQSCGAVDDVQIYVDDELRCTSSPCTVNVQRGGHVVRAETDGQSVGAAEAVLVSAGQPTLHKVRVGPSPKTGIEVRANQPADLFIDGKAEGALPRRVTGLSAGEHQVRVVDHGGKMLFERRVAVDEDQLLLLDAAAFATGSGGMEREERESKPVTNGETASAESTGSTGSGTPGQASGSGTSGAAAESVTSPTPQRSSRAGKGKPRASAARPARAATNEGTLNLSAEPSALVVLDGRPLGHTPQRVRVKPGTHALIFVHPLHGREKVSISVKAGQTRNLQARF